MNEIQEKFLEALRVSLKNGTVWWEEPLQPGQWRELFGLAETHHVLPLIYEAVYRSPAAGQADPRLMMDYKWKTVQLTSLQALKTESFLCLMESLNRQGVYPVTVKGIICRNLYPKPDGMPLAYLYVAAIIPTALLLLRQALDFTYREELLMNSFSDYVEHARTWVEEVPVPEKADEAVKEEIVEHIADSIRQTAAAGSHFSGMLTPEEDEIMREIIREFMK